MSTAALRTSPAPASPPGAHAWRRAFADLPREHGFEPLRLEGRLPDGLRGTLYRSGPSLFSNFGRRYGHWFDGDGAVSAVRFDGGGGATGAVKLIQSAGLLEERRRGRPYYAGYGTPAPGLWRGLLAALKRDLKNTGNTSVMIWQGRLYAMVESSRPTELSVDDLSTLGERDLDAGVSVFSAHPHYVPARRTAYNFGVRYGRRTEMDLFALPDEGPARRLGTVTLPGATMIHDFIATDRYLVFFAPPLRLRILRTLVGRGTFGENLRWQPGEGTEVLVVPIDDPTRVRRFTTPAFYQWHFATAFERGDELVVDYVRYPDFASNRWLGEVSEGPASTGLGGKLHRARIDPARGSFADEERAPMACEFPRVARPAQANRQVYVVAHSDEAAERGMFDRVARIDVERGTVESVALGEAQYPSEPVFVRRPDGRDEDDGWLLTLVYDGIAHQSGVAVLDAREPGRGPIARAWFDHHVPFTFHGNFAPRP
ncbi:MAG: carotenoid oxygenase family protein [Polyangia bacterium]